MLAALDSPAHSRRNSFWTRPWTKRASQPSPRSSPVAATTSGKHAATERLVVGSDQDLRRSSAPSSPTTFGSLVRGTISTMATTAASGSTGVLAALNPVAAASRLRSPSNISAASSVRSSAPPLRLTALPQDVTLRILAFLPPADLARVAACSRRLKVLAYNDALFERKLRIMQLWMGKDATATGTAFGEDVKGPDTAAAGAATATSPTGTLSRAMFAADLVPPRQSATAVPLHVRECWTRLSPAFTAAPAAPGTDAVGLADSATPAPTTGQARTLYRRIHRVLWPYYAAFRPRSAIGVDENGEETAAARRKNITDLADPVEQAIYLTAVRQFGRAVLVDDAAKITENIRAQVQVYEAAKLSAFDRSLEASDIDGQRAAATCLFYLNGGESCVQLFIYKSPIFFDHSRDVTENFQALSLEGGQSSPLQQYLDTISTTLDADLPRITKIFPHPTQFQYLYVQKVFDDCIIEYLSRLLVEANQRDLAVFLNSLTLIFEHCSALITSLADRLDAKRLEAMLRKCLSPFTAQYMDRELADLRARSAAAVDAWWTDLRARQAKRSAAAAAISAVSSSAAGAGTAGAAAGPGQAVEEVTRRVLSGVRTVLLTPQALVQRAIRRAGGTGGNYAPAVGVLVAAPGTVANGPESPSSPAEDEELDALLSLELALTLIDQNKASLKRCVVMMSPLGDVKPHVEKLFCLLTRTLGEKHIRPCYDMANERLSAYKASEVIEVLPLIQLFAMNQVADAILQLVHTYFSDEIARYINLNDFLSESIQEKKKFEQLLDDCVATGLDRAMVTLMAQTEFLLATEQRAADFDPPDDVMTDTQPTPACRAALACLQKHLDLVAQRGAGGASAGDKHILQVFVGEVGARFFTVVTKHIKRQKISQVGGFRLMCDINAYAAWADNLRNADVARLFKALKELTNIYVVSDIASLKPLVKDQTRYAGVFRVEDMYEFLECRTDFEKIKSRVKESECVIM
ncbi:F-box protein: endocytic membrane traffic, recycling ReCYcling 1 [Allomyces javanicus]|nr:F-box protein: endocytic membrane traffic, recycling ReCYcling 1 [Allomyces javanicus]